MTGVSDLFIGAFSIARHNHSGLAQNWIKCSHALGSLLPNSALLVEIQRLGDVDLVLRCMEEDKANPNNCNSSVDIDISKFNYQSLFSDLWICKAHAILEVFSRKKLLNYEAFIKLRTEIELIRVAIEKHEIPKDGLLNGPIFLKPQIIGQEETAPMLTYDPKSFQKSYLVVRGISSQGSLMWQPIDLKNNAMSWLERRSLADRFLDLKAIN